MANDDKYWDLELFESPKKEYPPMTTDDYRYIIAGIGKMIDEVAKAFTNIHTASQRYRIIDRLNTLDIMEMEIRHEDNSGYFQVSCESLIGSATWMLIPPVLSMITPKREECIKFLELFELLADAVANNM